MIYFFLESSSTFVNDISNYIEINKIIYLSMIREKKHNKMSCIEWDDSFKNDKVIFEQSHKLVHLWRDHNVPKTNIFVLLSKFNASVSILSY